MCTNNLSDESLAEKFRRENPEQFFILVRMHLSFLLDVNTDENDGLYDKKLKKWSLVSFGKKFKYKNGLEGPPLTQEGICQIFQLIEYLKKEENLRTEGIFRKSGSLERQQELRGLLSQGITLELEGGNFSVHDCATVLKGFLAELPDPLLTEAHFPVYCQIAELCGIIENKTQETKLLEALQLLLLLLPSENKMLLKDLLELLFLTTSHEQSNKMSSDNLAKLFTPHLLIPRKLSPEHLLSNSQTLFGIVSFMIKKGREIFHMPSKLLVDFRVRYEKKHILSPTKQLNETVNDAANTVFTFVDKERTAKENEENPTETHLAQLYAHIQSMPESSKKRKLVKQFNKENGHGTPLQVARRSGKNKSFGDSIKKHIFQKGLVRGMKKGVAGGLRGSSEELLSSPPQSIKTNLFCTKCDSSSDSEETCIKKQKYNTSTDNLNNIGNQEAAKPKRSNSEPNLSVDNQTCAKNNPNNYITSTPACTQNLHACTDLLFTPEDQDRKSMSPITRSTQRMPRAMQETMMTPRSRKPVLLISGTNINKLAKLDKPDVMDEVVEEKEPTIESLDEVQENHIKGSTVMYKSKSEGDINPIKTNLQPKNSSFGDSSLTNTFREYLSSRDILVDSEGDLSFSSRTDDFNSNDFDNISSNKLTDSLLGCLNGEEPEEEKKLVLKPKQFDEDGKIIFETSF